MMNHQVRRIYTLFLCRH